MKKNSCVLTKQRNNIPLVLRGDVIEAYSAGIEWHGPNPTAVRVMVEAGVAINSQKSKLAEELPIAIFDYVITLCGHAFETCPLYSGTNSPPGFSRSTAFSKGRHYGAGNPTNIQGCS